LKTRTLVACLAWTAVAALLALGPDLVAHHRVWSRAARYELEELEVTGSECRGGERVPRTRGYETTPLRCWYRGTIDGREEVFDTGSSLPGNHPPGTTLKVWFDRETYETSLDGKSLRIRWHEDRYGGDDLERRMRRSAQGLAAVLGLALVGVVALDRLCRARLPGRREAPSEDAASLDMGGGIPFLGIPCVSLGAALVVEPLASWTPPSGRWVFGALLLAVGIGMLARRTVRFPADGTLVAGWSWLGFPIAGQSVPAPAGAVARVASNGEARTYEVRLGKRRLGVFEDHSAAVAAAERIAQLVGCPARVDAPLPARRRRLSPRTRAAVAVLVVLPAIIGPALLPAVRERVYLAVLPPDGPPLPQLWRWAARRLAGHPTPESVQALVRLVNTTWEDSPRLAADSLASLERIAGREPGRQDDAWESAAWVNPWAAERLGRALDANGGVLGWYAVDERLRAGLDALASPDPEAGAAAWSLYGAGIVTSPETFLLLGGAALADPRPIAFAIVAGREGESAGPTALPEPLAAHAEPALARTVGEALALRYWLYLAGRQEALAARTDREAAAELARLDVGDFPLDFRAWWTDHARTRRLPPAAVGDPGAWPGG
jgi:hypothetical protein